MVSCRDLFSLLLVTVPAASAWAVPFSGPKGEGQHDDNAAGHSGYPNRHVLYKELEGRHGIGPGRRWTAAPMSKRDGENTFSVGQIRNPHFRAQDPLNGLQAMLRAFEKYGAPLTPALRTAVRLNPGFTHNEIVKRDGNMTGTIPAVPPNGQDYEFLSPIQIGTPPQTLMVGLDTGSADLWVFSSETPKAQVDGHDIYTPSASNTSSRVANATWQISYGDGSGARGNVYTDLVALGAVSYPAQVVESATWVSPEFTSDPHNSGLLGLGMSHGNTVRAADGTRAPALTFMDNVRDQLAAPLFTANLKSTIPGTYSFGFINETEHVGDDIFYTPVDDESIYWTFTVAGYRHVFPANGTEVGSEDDAGVEKRQESSPPPPVVQEYPFAAIADTGTTLALLPDSVVADYWLRVPGSRYDESWAAIVFPCAASLPDWEFYVDGEAEGPGDHGGGAQQQQQQYRGVVPGRYMNYGRINSTFCYGGLQSSDGIGFSVFGGTVLKAQFVVFDLGGMRLGWAGKELET